MPCYSPLRGFKDKNTGGITFKRGNHAGADMRVPCGQCLGCRDDYGKHWAARIVHEATLWRHNCFITLTYRDKALCTPDQLEKGLYLPDHGSLVKSHFQNFMKRLREHFKGRCIRYYQCGEYGDENGRPHYHACLFNVRFDDQCFHSNNYGNPLFTSETLEDLWSYGYATIGELTYDSAAYTAGYIFKKVTGSRAHDHYLRFDDYGNPYWLEPEYVAMSRGSNKWEKEKGLGGLGKKWIECYHEDVFPSDELPIPGKGIVRGVPRYYETICESIDPLTIEEVKKARQKFAEEHLDEYSARRLEDKFKCNMAMKKMKRRREV